VTGIKWVITSASVLCW